MELLHYLSSPTDSPEKEGSCKLLLRIAKSQDIAEAAQKLSALKTLDLSAFPGSKKAPIDSSFLAFLPHLIELNISYQPLNNLAPIYEKKNLKSLHCKGIALKNIIEIGTLSALEELSIAENNIFDLSPLQGLLQIKNLHAAQNIIEDLSPLSKLKTLRTLSLSENRISDLVPLEPLRELCFLDLRRNRIRNIKPLKELTYLRELSLSGNPIDEEDLDFLPRSIRID